MTPPRSACGAPPQGGAPSGPAEPVLRRLPESVDGGANIQHLMRPGTLQLAALPPLALYVHLPWCLKKCPYCDFNSHASNGPLPESRYLDALGGQPGVISAHYAPAVVPDGADREARRRVQDAANNALLLQRLHGASNRRAHFVSTLVAVRHAQDPQPLVAMGRWPGEILSAPRGELGFGYDPLMYIPDLGCTVAEMEAPLKNLHSHRARSVAQMLALLHEVWRL